MKPANRAKALAKIVKAHSQVEFLENIKSLIKIQRSQMRSPYQTTINYCLASVRDLLVLANGSLLPPKLSYSSVGSLRFIVKLCWSVESTLGGVCYTPSATHSITFDSDETLEYRVLSVSSSMITVERNSNWCKGIIALLSEIEYHGCLGDDFNALLQHVTLSEGKPKPSRAGGVRASSSLELGIKL